MRKNARAYVWPAVKLGRYLLFCGYLLLGLCLSACEIPGTRPVVPTPIKPVATLPGSAKATAVASPTAALPTPTPPATSAPLPTATHDGALADWTVLVYLDADNNLEQAALLDMNEMEAAGSSASVNVLVQIDRAFGESYDEGDWTDTRRYRILGDADTAVITAEPLLTLGEQNMGDPATLADFIRWGIQSYPANRYALILWDHGAGWKGIAFDNDAAGLAGNDHLSLADLDGALAAGLQGSGVSKLDVVGFDACLMGQIDVFNMLRPYAHYAVGSEELTPGPGWDYESLLRTLYARPQWDGRDLATQMVNSFIAYYTTVEKEDFVTMSAVDLVRLSDLTHSIEQLAAVLAQDPAFVGSAIGDARSGAETFARVYPHDVDRYAAIDLYHFASILAQRSPDEDVAQAAQAVMTAVTQATIANGHGTGFDHSRGVAVYFPRRADFYDPDYAATTHLPNWDAFLKSYHKVGLADLPPPAISLHNVLNNVVGVQDPAFIEFQVVGRDVENVLLLAGLYGADGRRRLVEYDNLIPEPTYLPDGSQVTEWRDGVHDDFFIWDTEVTYLFDSSGHGDYVVMWPTQVGSTLFTVQGQLRRANDENAVDANLVFDHSTGQMVRVWAVQSNESNAPAEILPHPDDEFQLYNFFYNADGTIDREPGASLFFDEVGQLYFEWAPLPNGNYFLGMMAENVAGGTAVSLLDLAVLNSEHRDAYQAYLDPYLGFKFLYPDTWYEPRYQDTLLYTTSQFTHTQMLITIYPNLDKSVTPETLKQQTLQQFGDVDILFADERVVAGARALSTAYGYISADGQLHSGVFLTFIDNTGAGFVVDVDGPAADEAATVAAVGTIADTWEFAGAGIGLQPGKWATIDLETFSVAQPANFIYQQVNGWEKFSSGSYTFAALRTQSASLDTTDVVAALVRDAGADVENFNSGAPYLFPLGGHVWTRADFSYDVAGLGTVWGFIMARVEDGLEVVAWAEAPAAQYNDLESGTFLTMIADLTLAK